MRIRRLVIVLATFGLLLAVWIVNYGGERASRDRSDHRDRSAPETPRAGPEASPDAASDEPPEPVPPTQAAVPDEAAATLSGTVVRIDGQPVPGARVRVWRSRSFEWDREREPLCEATADGAGAFELVDLRGPLVIVAEAEGLACREALVGKLAPGTGATGATLVMDAARTWRGRVLDENGKPVPDAAVRTWPVEQTGPARISKVAGLARTTPTGMSVRSAGDGAFAVGPLPIGAWSLVVEHDEYAQWSGRLPEEREYFEIQLERGVEIAGVVLRWDGAPAAGASIAAHAMGPVRRIVTDAEGRFRIRGLRDGPLFHLTVRASNAAARVHEIDPDRRSDIEIRLEPPQVLAGVVVDPDGQPVADARIHIQSGRTLSRGVGGRAPPALSALLGNASTTTDAAGRFRYDGLPQDRYTIAVSAGGGRAPSASAIADAGTDDVRIVLTPREETVLSGTVRDADTGAAVKRFKISVWKRGGGAGGQATVESEDGTFRWAGKRIDELRLRVQAPGYARWDETWVPAGNGERRYDVRLYRATSVSIRVVEENGSPFLDWVGVQFQTVDGRPITPSRQSGIALEKGAWSGHGLPRGPIRILLVTPIENNEYTRWTFDIDLREQADGAVELVVDRDRGEPLQSR